MTALWSAHTVRARVARGALLPFSGLYGAATALRGWGYDRGWLAMHEPAIPVIAVGNLTVGGTGKTPVAAWIAAELRARRAHPAIVLRGYRGGDEAAVHEVLNPTIPVVTGADRRAAVERARAMGCDVAVLDDAFQHRRLRRSADVVLVSADALAAAPRPHLLPAGPWREPLAALRRATLAVVTRKAALDADVDAAVTVVRRAAPELPVAVARLSLGELRTLEGQVRALEELRDASVYAIAGIGDPAAFFAQLERLTPHLSAKAFRDHHRYTAADTASLVRDIARCAGVQATVVCTLKDAVKLAPVWPRAASGVALWFVSQRVVFERGGAAVEAVLDSAARARPG